MLRFLFLYNVMFISPIILGIVACVDKYGLIFDNFWIVVALSVLAVNVVVYILFRNEINK